MAERGENNGIRRCHVGRACCAVAFSGAPQRGARLAVDGGLTALLGVLALNEGDTPYPPIREAHYVHKLERKGGEHYVGNGY
jgi:hypothetical protein